MRNFVLMGVLMVVIAVLFIVLRPFEFVVPRVTEALTPLICPDGGTVATREEPGPRGGVYISYLCVRDDGITQSSGFPSVVVILGSFCLVALVPLVPLVLYLWIEVRRKRLRTSSAS
jgi:hypothetical protein